MAVSYNLYRQEGDNLKFVARGLNNKEIKVFKRELKKSRQYYKSDNEAALEEYSEFRGIPYYILHNNWAWEENIEFLLLKTLTV